MIYDKIDSTDFYKGLSDDIYEGLKFLQYIDSDIATGVYQINPRVKAIVSEYVTKKMNENGYEAHRKYIDIQYLISGSEKICCLPLEYLSETTPYSEDKDIAFYEVPGLHSQELPLGNGYFSIFFPQDAHMPQLCLDTPSPVKKVVIKVEVYT